MTRAEKILASRLLEMAAAEFHEHGCTDTPHEIFKGVGVTERSLLLGGFNEWWCRTDGGGGDLDLNLGEVQIDVWMEYLAHRIGESS